MPTAANRRLFRGGGAKKPAKKVKAHERKRGGLRAAKFAAEGMAGTIGQCCKCKYNSSRCEALRKSDGERCNYCAYRGSKWCGKHQSPESRGGPKPKKRAAPKRPTKSSTTKSSTTKSSSTKSSSAKSSRSSSSDFVFDEGASASSAKSKSKSKSTGYGEPGPDFVSLPSSTGDASVLGTSLWTNSDRSSTGSQTHTWKKNASGKGGYVFYDDTPPGARKKKTKAPSKSITDFLRAQQKRSEAARAKERRAKEKKAIADSKGLVKARARTSRNSISTRADRRRARAIPAPKPNTRKKKKQKT